MDQHDVHAGRLEGRGPEHDGQRARKRARRRRGRKRRSGESKDDILSDDVNSNDTPFCVAMS